MIVVLIIIAVLAVIAFFAGMADDDVWNLVNVAGVLAISLVLLISSFCLKSEIFAIFEKATGEGEDKTSLYAFLFALIFIVVGFVLGSPLIWAWKEKEYFFIFGTLASKTDYSAGIGLAIAVALVYGVPAGLCFAPAAERMSIWLFIIPSVIATAVSLFTFIFAVRKYRDDN